MKNRGDDHGARRRGRPPTGKAKTAAERMRDYRVRQQGTVAISSIRSTIEDQLQKAFALANAASGPEEAREGWRRAVSILEPIYHSVNELAQANRSVAALADLASDVQTALLLAEEYSRAGE